MREVLKRSRSRLPAVRRVGSTRAPSRSRVASAPAIRQPAKPTDAERVIESLARRIRKCVQCPLHRSRTQAVPGAGPSQAPLMIIGEGPGKQEDQMGEPFVGNAGRYLDHVLEGTPFKRSDFFITNIVKCRPPNNRAPKTEESSTCTSLYLFEQIRQVNPKIILLLGSVAVKTLLGAASVEQARGRITEKEGRKYLASYHPAVRFYREDLAQRIKQDFELLRKLLSEL